MVHSYVRKKDTKIGVGENFFVSILPMRKKNVDPIGKQIKSVRKFPGLARFKIFFFLCICILIT